jgi:transcriptional regulator with XRE-family HTH domain/transposase
MQAHVARRERLNRFVDLARAYRGWSRQELASRLGRDLSKIVPGSGNPKLDLVVALAEALEWDVGDVVQGVWDARWEDGTDAAMLGLPYGELDARALAAHRSGDWAAMRAAASAMLVSAGTPEDRARALNRFAGAYEGLGRFGRSVECLRAALSSSPLSPAMGAMLRVNLAGAHYALWNVVEARATAHEVIEGFAHRRLAGRAERIGHALALMHRGQCARRLLAELRGDACTTACEARDDLACAAELLAAAHADWPDAGLDGHARTCHGALLEARVAAGELAAEDAVDMVVASLVEVEDPDAHAPGPWLESHGWWCVYGCNVALAHLDEPVFGRAMAILTNKAIDIAERTGSWPLRERALTLEHARRERGESDGDAGDPWIVDEEDVRTIAGAMGRFPSFRETGWRILASARVVGDA